MMPANIEYLNTRRSGPEHWAAQDDGQLMAAVAQGNKGAFTALVTRHLNPVIRYAQRYVGTLTDAQDVAQEAFIRLWKHATRWEQQGFSLRSWVFRITYNLCIDELRKRKPTTSIEQDDLVDSNDLPEKELAREQHKREVTRAINELPERQRDAIILCVYQGLTNIEAAATLDVSVDALESLLSRGRRSLKKKIMEMKDSD